MVFGWVALVWYVGSAVVAQPQISGEHCSGVAAQHWSLGTDGTFKNAKGLCLTAGGVPKNGQGTSLTVSPCTGSSLQGWSYNQTTGLLTLTKEMNACVNLRGYKTNPGSQVWLYESCTIGPHGDCKGNCDWHESNGAFVNHESGLCLDDGTGPPAPRTCSPGSVAAHLPFCDTTKTFEERAALLTANLTLDEKLSTYMLEGMLVGIPRLNVKRFSWDSTDIHGVDPEQSRHLFPKYNNTVYPYAIALGATFNLHLIEEVSRITAMEARILESHYYRDSRGTFIGATSFDGGPLANVAYDPRVGRTAEMYGEDPYHVSRVGVTATIALQNRTLEGFLQTSQVTRHFITDHGSKPDNTRGMYTGDIQWLEDEYLPTFEAFQMEGKAEGLMFSISALNGMASCMNEFLWTTLRKNWGSDCLAQTDCCGTFTQAVRNYKNFPTMETAVVAALKSGIQLDYGDAIGPAIQAALKDGTLPEHVLDSAIQRAFLTRFRLGEFDEARNPFLHYNPSDLDSPAHRESARRVMSASVVLLKNAGGVLPLRPKVGSTIAVIGPFADCPDRTPGYGGHPCYLHSYNGQPSYISTILGAIQEDGTKFHATVTYAKGSTFVGAVNATEQAAAVKIAGAADVVVLALGLGQLVESEGLDRSTLKFPTPQQSLLEAVRKSAKGNVVLAINSAGGVALDTTLADAILQIWYGGQETGHGLADILFGRVNPSGRLPLTVHPESYLAEVGPVYDLNMVFNNTNQGRTYRYLNNQSAALFSFGFGLSYTTFHYSACTAIKGLNGTIVITVTVTNTGSVAGIEIVQLYVTVPHTEGVVTPKYALQGFTATPLEVGSHATHRFILLPRQLTTVMRDGHRIVTNGNYIISVSGHLPDDPRAYHVSNVVTAEFTM